MAKNQIKFKQIDLHGDTFLGATTGEISLKDASSATTGVLHSKLAYAGSGDNSKGVVLGNTSNADAAISEVLFQRSGILTSAANELVTADLIKAAIDASTAGLSWKKPVSAHNAASETDISASYTDGTDTLVLDGNSRYKIDGVFLGTCGPSLGQGAFVDHVGSNDLRRVLISGEDSNQERNGIYDLTVSQPPLAKLQLGIGSGSFDVADFNGMEITIVAPDAANSNRTETFVFLTGAGTNGALSGGNIEVRIGSATSISEIAQAFKDAVHQGNCLQDWRQGISRIDVNEDAASGGAGLIHIYAYQQGASAIITNGAISVGQAPTGDGTASPTAWAMGVAAELVRSDDANDAQEVTSAAVFVSQGDTRDDRAYVQSEMVADIDNDAQVWVQFTGAYKITSSDSSLSITGDDIVVANDGIGEAQLDSLKMKQGVISGNVSNGYIDITGANLPAALHATAGNRAGVLAALQDSPMTFVFLNGVLLEYGSNLASDGDFNFADNTGTLRISFATDLITEGDQLIIKFVK